MYDVPCLDRVQLNGRGEAPLGAIGCLPCTHPWNLIKPNRLLVYGKVFPYVLFNRKSHLPTAAQASSEHSISVAIEASGAAAAKKITEEAFAMEIRSETVAVDVIR